jgi:hypothetical protein
MKSRFRNAALANLSLLVSASTKAASRFIGATPDGSMGLRSADFNLSVSAADFTTSDAWQVTDTDVEFRHCPHRVDRGGGKNRSKTAPR